MTRPGDPRREALAAVAAAHPAGDTEESRAIGRLLELLEAPPDPFDRSTLPLHVTASAVVLSPDGQVLLHRHRRLARWLQPGGHIEADEAPAAAALRETVEETGLRATHPLKGPVLLHIDEHPGPDRHVHLDLRYLLHADPAVPADVAGEDGGDGGPMLRWVATDTPDLFDRSLLRAVRALRDRLA